MEKRRLSVLFFSLLIISVLTGCDGRQSAAGGESTEITENEESGENGETGEAEADMALAAVIPTEKITELEEGLSVVRYDGDYGFNRFLEEGGASSDREVAGYLAENLLSGLRPGFAGGNFGCSTVTTQNPDGTVIFGRNFDWNSCDAMIVMSYPENGYASISTVNVDFIRQGTGDMAGLALKADEIMTAAGLYAPLDGMNEKGLAVAVNMIQDAAEIDQDTEKPDITTTTAVRLLLDKAGTVEEALELLGRYDLHASMGMMVHLAVADASGNSVAVEYIGNKMAVTETPAVTNFYLTEGEKYGIGTKQSHERYDILMDFLKENPVVDEEKVRDALDRVSKDNFGEFESTEWSIVFSLNEGKAVYYHRENYTQGYVLTFQEEAGRP